MTFYDFFCRAFQVSANLAMPILDWKEPQVLRGPGSIEELPGLIKSLGLRRVLLVTDPGLVRLGLPLGLLRALEREGVACAVYDRTQTNPTIQNMEEAHALFRENLARNVDSERERIFCKHDITHLLNVARVAQLLNIEQALGLDRELIYAAALLHDITKWKQQQQGVPHHISALAPAAEILAACGFNDSECDDISDAIYHHREGSSDKPLARVIYTADKRSRTCFLCLARGECKKSDSAKLDFLEY